VDESKIEDSVCKYSAPAEDSDSCTGYLFEGPLYVYESKVEDSFKQAAPAEDSKLSTGTLKSDAKVDGAVYACPAPAYVAEDRRSNGSAYSSCVPSGLQSWYSESCLETDDS
jgi:hypothetical protein